MVSLIWKHILIHVLENLLKAYGKKKFHTWDSRNVSMDDGVCSDRLTYTTVHHYSYNHKQYPLHKSLKLDFCLSPDILLQCVKKILYTYLWNICAYKHLSSFSLLNSHPTICHLFSKMCIFIIFFGIISPFMNTTCNVYLCRVKKNTRQYLHYNSCEYTIYLNQMSSVKKIPVCYTARQITTW